MALAVLRQLIYITTLSYLCQQLFLLFLEKFFQAASAGFLWRQLVQYTTYYCLCQQVFLILLNFFM